MARTHYQLQLLRRRALAALFVIGTAACNTTADDHVAADSTAVVDTPVAAPTAPVIDSAAPRLAPIDQADSSFRSFRAATLEALSRQDTAYLYRMLTADIKNSFGGDDSIAGFKRIWRMNEPNSQVWGALARVLNLGGKQETDSLFIAPYVYAFWPDTIDAFEHVAVVTPNALLRAAATDTARAVGRLSHSIVKVEEWRDLFDGNPTDSTWVRVTLPRGATGWVRGQDVYSPVGWRAFFVKRNGQWLMQLFVAGD